MCFSDGGYFEKPKRILIMLKKHLNSLSFSCLSEVEAAREWRLISFGSHSPSLNMAIDEAIFRLMAENKPPPTLRLYTWNPQALSIGYFQNTESPLIKEYLKRGYPLVRRPTGGLAVLHKDEMSYSMIGVFAGDGFPANRQEAYRKAHESIKNALNDLGFEVNLYEGKKSGYKDDFCSSSCVAYDIILGGKGKIGGSAQRTNGEVLLQHGCISLPEKVDRGCLREKVAENFEFFFQIKLKHGELTDAELSLSEKLAKEKYEKWEWNYKGGRFLSRERLGALFSQ